MYSSSRLLPSEKCNSIKHLGKHSFVCSVVHKAPSNRVGIKKKILLCEKNFDNFKFNVQPNNFWNFVFWSFSLTPWILDREIDIICADYFKLTTFWKKQFLKNVSFTNLWFVGSGKWFLIHKSQLLNSISIK